MSTSLDRSNDDAKEFEDMVTILKNYIPRTEAIVKETLNGIPITEPYSKYRQELEAYLKYMTEFKSSTGNCVDKLFRTFYKLAEIGKILTGRDVTFEAEEVHKQLNAHGIGSVDLDFFKWKQKYNVRGFSGKVEDRYSKEDPRFKTIYSEVC